LNLIIKDAHRLEGKITVPGDKSISHRTVMLGALARGTTEVNGFLMGEDCLNTVRCFRKLGVNIEISPKKVSIEGRGLGGLKEPEDILDVGNSGTTIRLLSGILAGQNFISFLRGDSSIHKRPMDRIIEPLTLMGAKIMGRGNNTLAPLAIKGGELKAIEYTTPVASAQVKSAILLAGLFADGWTKVSQPAKSRDHTEIMLKAFGAQVEEKGNAVMVKGRPWLQGQKMVVPGDISSAAFFLVAGAISSQGSLTVRNVGLNPTRSGIIDVLIQMGAKIYIRNTIVSGGEPMGDISIESSSLQGVQIAGDMVPRLIDEIPVIAVLGACAAGITEIRDAQELKVKESNRLSAIAGELSKMGVPIEELPDGLRIYGGKKLKGAVCESHHDHRIAMALAVAGLVAQGTTVIKNAEVINISFPGFANTLRDIGVELEEGL
jgi:3-phosphoshikimate 1-carboxyvinyltransferase